MPLLKIKDRVVSPDFTLIASLRLMDSLGVKILFVYYEDIFEGLLTLGDIQRAIINNLPLTSEVGGILDKTKIYASVNDKQEVIIRKMRRLRAECMPVIDDEGMLVDVIFWKDLFKDNKEEDTPKIDLPVVIMAGGKGTRLKPLTNVLPKPLIPVGDKTIIEEIMSKFDSIGCKKFYISVNYKSDILHFYLDRLNDRFNLEFFEEPKPLGTIGSVALLRNKISTPFFVSNCDILVDQDFRDVYAYHQSNHNDITIVTAVKSTRIPYGVIETGENGLMVSLSEKPEHTYQINTGVYLINSEVIDEIPYGEFFHITHLMEKVKLHGGRVGCFPVSEHAWRDMGEWPEYLKMIDVL